MPAWFEGMTAEDYRKNHDEMKQWDRHQARLMRLQAKRLLKRADELDPPEDQSHD